MKKIYRSNKDFFIGGVCGGIAEIFNVDSIIIRIIFVLFGIYGAGLIVYLFLWIFLPERPLNIEESAETSNSNNEEKDGVFNMKKEGDSYSFFVERRNNTKRIFAIVLIVAGVLFLLENFLHLFRSLNISRIFGKIWPIGLIILGIILLSGNNSKKENKK